MQIFRRLKVGLRIRKHYICGGEKRMALDYFILGAQYGPGGGIALLILLLYFTTFLLQRFLGYRMPNEGEISSIALSLTAFVLSIYLLISTWNTFPETPYTLGYAFPFSLSSVEQVPFILSIGILITPFNALLISILTAMHFIMMIGISVYQTEHRHFSQIFAQGNLLLCALLVALVSPDIPVILLAFYVSGKALHRLKSVISDSDEIVLPFANYHRFAEISILIISLFLFYTYHSWHKEILSEILKQFSHGFVDISWKSTYVITKSIPKVGISIMMIFLLSALMAKSWLPPFSIWTNLTQQKTNMHILWGYTILMIGVGLFTGFEFSIQMPPELLIGFVFVGCIISIWASINILSTWQINHFLVWGIILHTGYMLIFWGMQQKTNSLLMLIFLLIGGVFAFGVMAYLASIVANRLQAFGLVVYKPKDELREKIAPTDVRFIQGIRTQMSGLFWLYALSVFLWMGMPLSIAYTAKVEFLNGLYLNSSGGSWVILLIFWVSTLCTVWAGGRQLTVMFKGESIISRIKKIKTNQFSIWKHSEKESMDFPKPPWRIWLLFLILGIPCFAFWLGSSPFNLYDSWLLRLYDESIAPPQYWLHAVWVISCLITFIRVIKVYRNKNAASLFKDKKVK